MLKGAVVNAGADRSKIAAFVLLWLGVGFYFTFAVGEVVGGDISGVQHLLPAAILVAVLWVSRRSPRRAGIVLLVLAVPFSIGYVALLVVRDLPLTWALVVSVPPVVTALLLARAGKES